MSWADSYPTTGNKKQLLATQTYDTMFSRIGEGPKHSGSTLRFKAAPAASTIKTVGATATFTVGVVNDENQPQPGVAINLYNSSGSLILAMPPTNSSGISTGSISCPTVGTFYYYVTASYDGKTITSQEVSVVVQSAIAKAPAPTVGLSAAVANGTDVTFSGSDSTALDSDTIEIYDSTTGVNYTNVEVTIDNGSYSFVSQNWNGGTPGTFTVYAKSDITGASSSPVTFTTTAPAQNAPPTIIGYEVTAFGYNATTQASGECALSPTYDTGPEAVTAAQGLIGQPCPGYSGMTIDSCDVYAEYSNGAEILYQGNVT